MSALEAVLAAVLSATHGARKMTDRQRRDATEGIRKSAVKAGASDLDAARISVHLASASADFADACVTANRKAHALAAAIRELEDLAEKLIDRGDDHGNPAQ